MLYKSIWIHLMLTELLCFFANPISEQIKSKETQTKRPHIENCIK